MFTWQTLKLTYSDFTVFEYKASYVHFRVARVMRGCGTLPLSAK